MGTGFDSKARSAIGLQSQLDDVRGAIAQPRATCAADGDAQRALAAEWLEGLFADVAGTDALRRNARQALGLDTGGMGSFPEVGTSTMDAAVDALRATLRSVQPGAMSPFASSASLLRVVLHTQRPGPPQRPVGRDEASPGCADRARPRTPCPEPSAAPRTCSALTGDSVERVWVPASRRSGASPITLVRDNGRMTDDAAHLPPCPECASEFTYESGSLLTCPMCGHEWAPGDETADAEGERIVKDAVGNVLTDGDTVSIIKDLKVKGAGGGTVKVGTKVRGIRLIADGVGDHDIDAKVPGFGQMQLKSGVVKKVV